MYFEFQLVNVLPKLAWAAAIHRGQPRVRLLHGPSVELRENAFFEGAWDGRFEDFAFDSALSCMGSGGRLENGRAVFVAPSHKLEWIQSVATAGALYISNSLAFLLVLAGEELDCNYPNYFFDYLRYFREGLTTQNRPIRLRSGNNAYLHICCNIAVDPALNVVAIPKPVPSPFTDYLDYADFLETTARRLAQNAVHPRRAILYPPVAAISRGYDSVAVAALAARAGCRRAVTFRHSGALSIDDSGAAIAAALGMTVTEYDRAAYPAAGPLPEVEFYPCMRLAAKALCVMEDQLQASLFFHGQAGEDYWDIGWEAGWPALQEPGATTMAGANITEFRLRLGAVFCPLATCGAIHAPAIARLGRSPEMAPWSIPGTSYNRPVPRRLAEDRGVPRHLFGQHKVGGGPNIGPLGLCPQSEADFRHFFATRIARPVSRNSLVPQETLKRRRRRVDALRRLVFSSARLSRFFRRLAGDRLDPRWASLSLYTAHWSFHHLRQRYASALRPSPGDPR